METLRSPYGFMFDHLQGIEDIILNINKLAMEALHENDFNTSVTLLQRANYMLKQQPVNLQTIKLKAITLNNLGCLYKRTNQNPKALQFLKEALECEKKLPGDYTNIAGTHLNICAIKSLLNHHEESLAHALKAINIIQQNPFLDDELIRSLVVAYYNAGTEYQYLHRNSEAAAFLRHGYNLSVKHLGKNHPLTMSFGIKNEKNKQKTKRGGKLKPIDFDLINKSLDLEDEKINEDIDKKNEESLLPDIFSKSRAQTIRNNDGIQLDTTPWIDDNKEKSIRGYFRNNKTKKIPLEERKSVSNEISTPRRSYKIPNTLREKIEKYSMSPRHEDSFEQKLGHKAGNKSEGQVIPFKFNSSIDKDSLAPSKNIVKNKINSESSTIKSDKQFKSAQKTPAKLNPINSKHQAKPPIQNIFQVKKDQNKSPFITYESPIPSVKTKESTNSLQHIFSKEAEKSPNIKTHKSSNSSLPRTTKDSSNSPFPTSKTKDSSNSPMPHELLATPPQPKKAVSPLSNNVKTRLNSIDDKLSTLQDRLNIFENNIQPLKELTEVDEDTISNISVPPDNTGKKISAAIKIQAKYKEWKEYQKYKKIKNSIIKIQKSVRGWISKKNYQKIRKNVIIIQKYVKGWICKENYMKMKLELKNQKNFGQQFGNCLIKTEDIQSQTDLNMRDPILSAIHLAPSKTLANKSLLSIIILIQAHIRGFLKRRWYEKVKKSIIIIQRTAKKYKFSRLYKEILHAIIFIQAMYRGYLARKHFKLPLNFGENAVFKSFKVW